MRRDSDLLDNESYYIQTELDDRMSCYQLVITIIISPQKVSFIWKVAFTGHFKCYN